MRQEEVFDAIIAMKHRMQHLAGYVQNDFDRMLADGMVTKQEISDSILIIDADFKKAILELDKLKNQVISIVSKYA